MTLILSTLLLSPLAANPSLLDGTWHLVAVEEDGQAFAPGTATLTVRRGRFEARDDQGGRVARPKVLRTVCRRSLQEERGTSVNDRTVPIKLPV